jgi:hypothetical protein
MSGIEGRLSESNNRSDFSAIAYRNILNHHGTTMGAFP